MTGHVRMRALGFTLIELMIVVAIVAVLALIAYPSYQDSVRKGRRGEAKSDLVEIAQALERCYTQNNSYLLCPSVSPADVLIGPFNQSPQAGSRIDYTVAFTAAPTRTTFGITATPMGDQTNDSCGTLALNQTGVKTPVTGSTGVNCW